MRMLGLCLSTCILLLGLSGCEGDESLPEEPQLFVDREALDFGQALGSYTTVDTEAYESLYIENRGGQTLEIASVTKTGASQFVVMLPEPLDVGEPLLLESGESATLQVTFRPTAAGVYEGSLQIRSNAANATERTIQLSGRGVGP